MREERAIGPQWGAERGGDEKYTGRQRLKRSQWSERQTNRQAVKQEEGQTQRPGDEET